MMKKTTKKIGHLDFLSLPWRLCRKLGVEKSILGRGKSFEVLGKTCRIQDGYFG